MQIEQAVRRNPRQPDYSGLDCILDSPLDSSGAVVPPKSTQHISELQKNEAQILKAGTQWREETTTRDKNKKGNGKNKKEGAGG